MAKLVTIFFAATVLAVAAGNDGDDFALTESSDDIQTYTFELRNAQKFLKKTWKQYQSADSDLTSKLSHLPMSHIGELVDAAVKMLDEKNVETLHWDMQFSKGSAVGVTANGNHKALPNIPNMEQVMKMAGTKLNLGVKGPVHNKHPEYTLSADVAALEMDLGKCVRNDTFEEKLSDDVEDLSDKLMQSAVAVYLKYWKKWFFGVIGVLLVLAAIPIWATKSDSAPFVIMALSMIVAGVALFAVFGVAWPTGKHSIKKTRDERKGSVEYSATGGGL